MQAKNLIHDYDIGETICGDCGLVVYEQTRVSGAALPQQEKHQEAVLAHPHHIQFTTKGYPQRLVKLTEMHLE